MVSNCLFYAIGQLWTHSGYIQFRRSHYWRKGFHVLWLSPDMQTVRDFVPLHPKRRWLPPFLFYGRVREFDTSHGEPNYHEKAPA